MTSRAEHPTVPTPLIEREPLIPERGVHVETAAERHAPAVTGIYRAAYERGDFFAGRYEDPERQIFDPDWLAGDFKNPDHHWFVFTDDSGDVVGVTGWFRDADVDGTPVLVSDETQVDPRGRGMNVMDRFFKRIVPELESTGAQLATEFVLTPESKGLRRTLQSELGMVALGIRPHALRHPGLGITRTEIAAAKPRSVDTRPVDLLPEYAELYQIVRSQLPDLPEPWVERPLLLSRASVFGRYEEKRIPADSGTVQRAALEAGYRPVVYDPQLREFTVARFPSERPDLRFIIENESVEANKRLVEYLDRTLYEDGRNVNNGGTESR